MDLLEDLNGFFFFHYESKGRYLIKIKSTYYSKVATLQAMYHILE